MHRLYRAYPWSLIAAVLLSYGTYFLLALQASWQNFFIPSLILLLIRILLVTFRPSLPWVLSGRIVEFLLLAFSAPSILTCLPCVAWGSSLTTASWSVLIPLLGVLLQVMRHSLDPLRLCYLLLLFLIFWGFDRIMGRLFAYESAQMEARLDLQASSLRTERLEQSLATSVVDAKSSARREERQTLSRELHDVIGHSLSATIMQIAAIRLINQQEEIEPLLKDVQEALDRGLQQTRETLHALHDENFSLQQQIEAVTNHWSTVKVEVDLPPDVDQYPAELRYDLWALIREALTNFMRHSKNDVFSLCLRRHPAFLTLTICDYPSSSQGRIDDPQLGEGVPVEEGMGLRNMREIALKYQGFVTAVTRGERFELRVILYRD